MIGRRGALALATAFAATAARAQGTNPAGVPGGPEPWKLVVPFPPGGQLDGMARLIADRAQRRGLPPVVVENRAGAGGNIGAAAAARARPDGRTLLLSLDTLLTVNPHLYADLGFDPETAFVPVALASSFPLALLVHPATGIADLAGFVAAARGGLFYSSGGIGSPGHLAMEHLRATLGLPGAALEHVPQRGNAEALTALLGNNVQAAFLAIGGGPDLVRGGRLRAIAVSGPARYPALPEVPTVAELGHPGFDVRVANILLAPRGTPAPAMEVWRGLVREVVADPAQAPRFESWGISPEDATAASAAAWIAAARPRWGQVARAAGMRAE